MVYSGDKVLDPLVMVNEEQYVAEDDPVNREISTVLLRKWRMLGVCIKYLFRVPSKVGISPVRTCQQNAQNVLSLQVPNPQKPTLEFENPSFSLVFVE